MNKRGTVLAQIDDVLGEWKALASRSRDSDYGDVPDVEGVRFITRAHAVVRRISRQPSAHVDHAEAIVARGGFAGYMASHLAGVVDALRADVAAGYLDELSALIHGELFGDFLDMALHLFDEKYKDAAAVIAGSSLEAHLRQLCAQANIDVEVRSDGDVRPRPKKADLLNSELVKAEVYSTLDQKNVTAWLDLRNMAAHGRYSEYEPGQVAVMISGIRDFISRHPA